MTTYKENSKDTTKLFLELITEFSKVTGYDLKAQKLVTFLHTNNKALGMKKLLTIPLQ